MKALCPPSGGRLASGNCGDGTIRLWDVASCAETARLEGHSGGVNALCLLSDGQLASSSDDGAIRLWDVVSGLANELLRGHHGKVSSLCRLTDGRLASGSNDNTICLWDVATGAQTARLHGHTGSVNALCLLHDGRLASGSDDETIRLWDVATLAETARLDGAPPVGSVLSVCWRTAGWPRALMTVRFTLWDIASPVAAIADLTHQAPVRALCLLNERATRL